MAETTPASTARTELRVHLDAGSKGVGPPFGRLTIDSHDLTVRSAGIGWIPARTVSRDAIGDISVATRVQISLPILRWRRFHLVTFDPAGPLADVYLRLPPRKRIVDVLGHYGYSVTDLRR